ncbi:hypothetical protein [Hyphomicrobium sp.]|uniref:hypothetical protein n=1 Tax=Hyphomicrobium sp. TaxID=82 RepID=UPI0025C49567|nr:hypothetical protein [Hyphomicrobium sp.]MCC7252471.1 hypothetical protein [Hyphomicrobium sp.]
MRNTPILLGALAIGGALMLAPLSPALAERDGPLYESYAGSQKHIREHARKLRRQELGYRESERKRLARLAKRERKARWRYESPWGPFAYPPGLF